MVRFARNVCSWFSIPHLWTQDMFWCLILVLFKMLYIEKGKDKLRSCVSGAEESEASASL